MYLRLEDNLMEDLQSGFELGREMSGHSYESEKENLALFAKFISTGFSP